VSVPARVYLYAHAAATPEEARDRQQSVEDLRRALAAARNIGLVDTEATSNVTVALIERAIAHPKGGIRVFPPSVHGPTSVVQLRLRLTYQGKSYDVAPRRWQKELEEGWRAAATDAARLVEEWIAKHVRADAQDRG